MGTIDGYDIGYPVLAGNHLEKVKGININSVIGTAIYIGDGFFMTAGHVVLGLQDYDLSAIGLTKSLGEWKGINILETEAKEDYDIGLIKTDFKKTSAFAWNTKPMQNLTDVVATGYPHGLENSSHSIIIRTFKGYVVSVRPFYRLKANPRTYELSFPCPRGISGAGLLEKKTGLINGLIIGAAKSEIDLYYDIEETFDSSPDRIYHKTESSIYGIAVCSTEILKIKFSLLEMPLLEYLYDNGLI